MGAWLRGGGGLIGREAELTELEALLGERSLITLTGLGGAGKTTIAAALARRWSIRGSRAVAVDLSSADDASSVIDAVAQELGMRALAPAGLLDAIASALTSRRSLLVLDNFEQVMEARDFVQALTAAVPSARIVVTSRVRLGIPPEHVVQVRPLGVPAGAPDVATAPAGRLFLERARLTADELDETELEAVAWVCRRVDGIPLAVQLAAGWGSVLTPRAIQRRLANDRISLTTPEPGRQASMRAVVVSTIELVAPDARVAFGRLGVLVGRFDEDAATAVVDMPDSLGLLRTLCEVGLVDVEPDDDGEPTFRMLETVRPVAAEELQHTGDESLVRTRHANHFASAGDAAAIELRARTFSGAAVRHKLADPNLVAAHDFAMRTGVPDLAVRLATAMGAGNLVSGNLTAGIDRLESSLRLGPVSPAVEADALNALLSLRNNRGERGNLELGRKAVAAARAADDPVRLARTLISLGNEMDEHAAAIPVLKEGTSVAEAVGDGWLTGNGRFNIGIRLLDQLDLDGAAEQLLAARAAFATIHEEVGIALADQALGDLQVHQGNLDAAIASYEGTLPVLRSGDGPERFLTASLTGLAVTLERTGDHDAAMAFVGEALDLIVDTENRSALDDVCTAAVVVLAQSNPAEAAMASALVADPYRTLAEPFDDAVALAREQLGSARFSRFQIVARGMSPSAVRDRVRRVVRASRASEAIRVRARYEALTPRETEVMRLLAGGSSDNEIASTLGISAKTASVHVSNIRAKLGVGTRVEAALVGQRLLDAAEQSRRARKPG